MLLVELKTVTELGYMHRRQFTTQQSASRATLPVVLWPGLARPPTSFLAASGKVVDGRPSPTMTHYQLSPYLPTADISYLKATGLALCLVRNFVRPRLEITRVVRGL
jgi:hypothetical protein